MPFQNASFDWIYSFSCFFALCMRFASFYDCHFFFSSPCRSVIRVHITHTNRSIGFYRLMVISLSNIICPNCDSVSRMHPCYWLAHNVWQQLNNDDDDDDNRRCRRHRFSNTFSWRRKYTNDFSLFQCNENKFILWKLIKYVNRNLLNCHLFFSSSYKAKFTTLRCDFPSFFLAHFECIANHEKLHHALFSLIFILLRAIMNRSNDFFYAHFLVLLYSVRLHLFLYFHFWLHNQKLSLNSPRRRSFAEK